MPIYYFDIRDGERDIDDEGTDLPDRHAARSNALVFAGDYVRDNPALLDPTGKLIVEVRDDARRPLFGVTISVSDLEESPEPS